MKTKFDAKTKLQVRELLREAGLEFLNHDSWVVSKTGTLIKSANNKFNLGRSAKETLAIAINQALEGK